MASEIRVNQIQSRTGVSTVSFTDSGPIFSGISTVQGTLTVGNTVVNGGSVPTAKLEVVGKSICGVVSDKTNYSNVLNTATNTGTAGFRTLNLIDESAVVKLARLHPDYGPALDLQHWSTDISTLYGRALIGITSANVQINNVTEDGYIYFNTRESGVGVSSERVRITGIGSVGIGTDIPAETLSVAGNVRVENSSNASQYLTINYQGIDFQNTGAGSSTTSSAHLLDDYEEGTWTPGIEGVVTPGTYTITSAVGTYTKIGNQVTIVGRMDAITETVAGSSSVQITGLPFASANNSVFSIGTIELTNWNIDNATNSLNCFALNGAVKLYIRETRDGLAIANVNLADLISGSSGIRLTMTYLTD